MEISFPSNNAVLSIADTYVWLLLSCKMTTTSLWLAFQLLVVPVLESEKFPPPPVVVLSSDPPQAVVLVIYDSAAPSTNSPRRLKSSES